MQISLGKITCVAPGTPVRATFNRADPTASFKVHAYTVQRLDIVGGQSPNTGSCYVSLSATDDRVALDYILGILGTANETSFSSGNAIEPNGIEMNSVYIDFDQAGDSVIIACLVS